MTWYRKEQPTPFDNQPIEGLHFLDGNILNTIFDEYYLTGQKCPLVEFPSGFECEIWEPARQENMAIVHLFGELDLPYAGQDRDKAFATASHIAEQVGYFVRKRADNQLEIRGFDTNEHLLLHYDNEKKYIQDVVQVKSENQEPLKHPGHILMNDEIAEQLPPLYANEDIGLDAVAPLKLFSVFGWTWYASEYDPDKKLFFGLVDGFELELGYFSLYELESIGKDGRTLPVERDLHYQPKTLKELQAYHRKLRGGQ